MLYSNHIEEAKNNLLTPMEVVEKSFRIAQFLVSLQV